MIELKYEQLGDMMPFYPRSTLVIRKQYVDAAIEELKEKADKLHSCLKCLVMRDLIKDCSEKKSAIEIVKEYKQ